MENSVRAAVLPGEQVLMVSGDGTLVLTSHRVRWDTTRSGASRLVSMTLGSVASCGLVTLSFPVLLLLAVLVFLGAFATHGDARYVLWFIAVAFVVAYFVSRQALLTISSSGGERIAVPARGVKRNDLIAFINEVEKAKLMYRG